MVNYAQLACADSNTPMIVRYFLNTRKNSYCQGWDKTTNYYTKLTLLEYERISLETPILLL